MVHRNFSSNGHIWTFDVDASIVTVVMMRIKGIQYRLYHKGALCDACVCTKAIMATKATNIYKCKSHKCKLEVQTWWQLHIKHHSCSFVSLAQFLFIFDTHSNRYIGKVCLQYIYWIGVVATAILNRCGCNILEKSNTSLVLVLIQHTSGAHPTCKLANSDRSSHNTLLCFWHIFFSPI